jgi:hypothetical protein
MRNLPIIAALTTMVLGATVPAIALADCQRQARAKRFGKLAVQRRNFLKDCMIDRGFYGQAN